jgi:hypothetical protein
VIDDLEVCLALHHQSQDAGHTGRGNCWSGPRHTFAGLKNAMPVTAASGVWVHGKVHGKVRRACRGGGAET